MDYCKRCNKEFDPSIEFVEDVNLVECLEIYIDTDYYCPKCLYDLDKKFVFAALNWDPNT